MRIHTIHILSFGGLREREFTPGDGVNVYYGENETGKTSVAMFVKFMLYGLNPKPDTADGLSERIHFVNRETGQAAGWMTVETADGVIWRIERALIVTKEGTAKERVRIVNTKTSDVINGQNPGEYFFGLPEEDYTATCFVAQNVRLKPGTQSGTGLARAIETLNGNDAADEIETLEKRRAALVEAQTAPRADAAEIESLTASLDGINARIRELEADQAEYDELYDALCTINVPRRFEVAEKTRAELDELMNALRAVAAGKPYLSSEIRQIMKKDPPIPELSQRQYEIIESITRGLSNNEIAKQLGIDRSTVKNHLSILFQKLGVANKAEAVAVALRKQLVKM